jgi:hypothetical protein
MLNKTVQFNTTDNDATTQSSIMTSMHDTSTAGTPTPTNPDLDEQVRNILSHIFGEAHADGELDKLITSVMKLATSQHHEWSQPKAQDIPAADLRKMLSQPQRLDKPSVMINGVEYIAKLKDVMYQVSNPTSRQCYHLRSFIVAPMVVPLGQTHGLLISPCALLIFKVSTTS